MHLLPQRTAHHVVHPPRTHQGTCHPDGLCSSEQHAWNERVTRNQASTIHRLARLVWPSRVQFSGFVSTTSGGQPSNSASTA